VITDFRVMGDQRELFGPVASVPTAWRALKEASADSSRSPAAAARTHRGPPTGVPALGHGDLRRGRNQPRTGKGAGLASADTGDGEPCGSYAFAPEAGESLADLEASLREDDYDSAQQRAMAGNLVRREADQS
jgi:hypothetical protein